jgi:hypothetical protein
VRVDHLALTRSLPASPNVTRQCGSGNYGAFRGGDPQPLGAGPEMPVTTNDAPWWGGEPHGDTPMDDDGYVPVRPPVALLAAAAGTALVSLALWLPGGIEFHLLGYGLSTFVTLGLIAGFKRADVRARQNPFYSPRSHLGTATLVVSLFAIAGAIAHTWVIATYWAG